MSDNQHIIRGVLIQVTDARLLLPNATIAEVLDVPPGTVRSRIARGRSQLARLLARNQGTTALRTSDGP